MKPSTGQLQAVVPGISEELIQAHLERLEQPYFDRFTQREIADHLTGLARLSADHPVEILVDATRAEEMVNVTILAFDHPAVFSLITGIMAGTGFTISSGEVFTYLPAARGHDRPKKRGAGRRVKVDPSRRRRIIDQFKGKITRSTVLSEWCESFTVNLQAAFTLLEKGTTEATEQAKHSVNEMVTTFLARHGGEKEEVLYPVDITIDNAGPSCTRVSVTAQDTPAFLYTLSTALSLQQLEIEHVRIDTREGRIYDEIDVVDSKRNKITKQAVLDHLKVIVLLTKQFTYFLDKAPDPYAALARFEHLTSDIMGDPESERWMSILSDPYSMRDLAHILGASDYLWEDFIRLQYESLLPILSRDTPVESLLAGEETEEEDLEKLLENLPDHASRKEKLNEYKNRLIFLIDLDHVLNPETSFRVFAERLTHLAEVVVRQATHAVFRNLVEKHGMPRTRSGLQTDLAIMGLGKLGGAALGYASDIELLFVYEDTGKTDGDDPLDNGDFFSRLVEEVARFIESKREGIFRVDLRLRPFGNSGPKACSLQSFCDYYGPGGPAHSFEHLALVRLRGVGSNPELCRQLERLRDGYIYSSPNIDLGELRDLRQKQFGEKSRPGVQNAKFSPGALVDLEYAVQILQITHAGANDDLKTPRIHKALDALENSGVLNPAENKQLDEAYRFFRELINALRMLRGSAEDLYLPSRNAPEYIHLARRMNYEQKGDLSPAYQLHLEFETRSAAVRTFVEKHFGRESLPGPFKGNVADLLMSVSVSNEQRQVILAEAGFTNTDRAYVNLTRLAERGSPEQPFEKVAVMACDLIGRQPDPDMALNNWERFVEALDEPSDHFNEMLNEPTHLELLLGIFARSQFLAQALIRDPQLWNWLTVPERLHGSTERPDLEQELRESMDGSGVEESHLSRVRRTRLREILRIGTREMYLGVNIQEVTRELSVLAESILQVSLEWTLKKGLSLTPQVQDEITQRFCILAFGKLGGSELNYSSDIDLLGVYDDRPGGSCSAKIYGEVMEQVHRVLTSHTLHGLAYRVDMRLRPHGGSGELISPLSSVINYYEEKASLWELQAGLKMRVIAGASDVGRQLVDSVHGLLAQPRDRKEVADSIMGMYRRAQEVQAGKPEFSNIKTGKGGIRDIEFLVQGLQMIHASKHPDLILGNTLEAVRKLEEHGLLSKQDAGLARDDYMVLRKIEHFLQIMEDRQIHTLPTSPEEWLRLARCMDGADARADRFESILKERLAANHQRFIKEWHEAC